MSLLNFEPSGPMPKGEKKSLKIFLGIGALVGTIALGSTLAASINLNNSGPVEFGQGVTQTTACDSQVEVTPNSSFVNSDGGGDFKFTSITLSDLDGTEQTDAADEGCVGSSLTIKTYDSDGEQLLPTYEISVVSEGVFTSLDGNINSVEVDSENISVTLTFDGILIDPESDYRITIESSAINTLVSNFAAVDAGNNYTCGLLSSGGVQCWGSNSAGQLGDGTTTSSSTPVVVDNLSNAIAVSAGNIHTCALLQNREVKCWGNGESGKLGDGLELDSLTPVTVSGLSNVVAISAGRDHTCALLNTGGVKCWGYNIYGQLGNETSNDSLTPADVSDLSSGVIAISAGDGHTCALLDPGGVMCWGLGALGRLGDGSEVSSSAPISVSGLGSGVTAISAGEQHTCALLSDGTVKCWGDNEFGELGDGNVDAIAATPVSVIDLSGVTAISVGDDHTCALISSGGVKCWGRASSGRLGNGSLVNRLYPVDVKVELDGADLLGVNAITSGERHTCARVDFSKIKCWGRNGDGQLGDGTTTNRSTPVDVVGVS